VYRIAVVATILAILVAVSFLPACGYRSSDADTDCDKPAIAEALAAQGGTGGAAHLDENGFGCSGGWAYAFADVGQGDEEVTVTFVLRSDGGSWKVANRAAVCKSPGDEVPQAIYRDACATN
jgi:hypothetical protein